MTRGAAARRRELSHGRVPAARGRLRRRCDARDLLRIAQRVGLDVVELTKLLRELKAVRRRLEKFFHAARILELLHEFTARRVGLSRWGTAETRHRSKHTEGPQPLNPQL